MDEVDIENAEDLNELEARLYAQIHHEPSGDCDFSTTYKEASPVRQVTASSVINNKSIDRTRLGRYWNDKGSVRTPGKQTPVEVIQPEGHGGAPSSLSGEIKETPAETVDKSFRPPVKNLSNLRVNPFASGNDPKTRGSSSQAREKNTAAAKSKKNDPKENKGPFGRQLTKLANAVKYDAKKQKAKVAKAKVKKLPAIESIELLSSNESETDEVIEVPLPSPKILTIDSSSDEDNAAEDINNFVKPLSSATKESSSRCTSPCSVVSDDFIGHSDRSRLLEENERPDDEDLLMLQEDVDSLMENPEKSTDKSKSFVTPHRGAASKTSADYRVTQNDFRALDVYESESDMQESVYCKGAKCTKPSLVVRLEHESSSGDEVEEVDITQKTKRLRKRRASSCNKESETYIDSTDSDDEAQIDAEGNRLREGVVRTRVPFIARGEAIEDYVSGDQSLSQRKVNSSDNEFIATLNTLAQGTSAAIVATSGNESDEEQDEEQITARAIAENVIRRESRNVETTDPVIVHDEEANDAIPNDSLAELNHVFEEIDKMGKNAVNVEVSEESDESVQLVVPLPVSGKTKPTKKLENDTGDPVYNIVYCEGETLFGGIGWNDEMRKFYNNSWNGERFNVKAICSQMKNAKSLWKIYTDDRFPKYHKHSNQKCMNCCEFGHIRSRCPKPRKPQVCYMCGERGHFEPRCPNTLCLRCGSKTRMFTKSCNSCNYQNRLICPICKVRGHSLNLCPDKWRRYHSTTKPNEYPNSKVEYKNRKFCCICGCRGHLAEHCRNALRFSEYPLFVSDIRSHQKSYDDISIKTMRSGIGYNLMYKPQEDLSFDLAENKTSQHYYGRFLIAVGMGHLLKRKRKVNAPSVEEPAEKQAKIKTALKEYVVNPFAKAALDKSPSKPRTSLSNTNSQTNELPIIQNDATETITSSSRQTSLYNEPTTSSAIKLVGVDVDDAAKKAPSSLISPFKAPNVASSSGQSCPSTPMDVEDVFDIGASTSTFKTPDAASISSHADKDHDVLEVVDSDSNYSFSEHFDTSQQKGNPRQAREMEPLPDFIPITDDGDVSPDEGDMGISKRFVSVDTDDENSNIDSNPMPDIPCEAKIYLTNFHSNFLLSPKGHKFLVEKSKAFGIKARLDWTSVGHILVIFGLRASQDKFHTELLHKFRELSDNLNRKQLESSQKVPRKTEVLIRFLREHLSQLLTNLGNVNDLTKRLSYQESQHTKSGWKSAEKTRRLLNMILIGQAGLRNGSKHVDHLLSHLRSLMDECKEEVVLDEVRDEIASHWKLIFSSYRHEKYDDLVAAYNHMQIKNRFQNINIDPRLLGKKILDTTLTKAQKEKMEKVMDSAHVEKRNVVPKFVPNPASTKHPVRQVKTPMSEKKRSKNVPTNSPSVSQTLPNNQKQFVATVNSPVANKIKAAPQNSPSVSQTQSNNQKQLGGAVNSPVGNKIKAVKTEWETKCVNLLTEIDNTGTVKKGTPVRDSKASSVFWSREALKYIDECMQVGKSNAGLIEKLSRVQTKSQKGLLSYNDYRAIIKIHNSIKGKQ